MNIPCILIPALVGIICGILGYLIGKMKPKRANNSHYFTLKSDLDKCESKTQSLNTKISSLEKELELCRANSIKLNTKVSDLSKNAIHSNFVSNSNPVILFNSELASTILGKKIKENDLKIIEGIGIKIEELYHNAGINTWLVLSQTSIEKSQSILDAAGEGFTMHNPGTWARQAELAYQGKWQELKDWQDILDGGKE
jgi:predicted flap endonuclease-1-like 5' DNA nuclease